MDPAHNEADKPQHQGFSKACQRQLGKPSPSKDLELKVCLKTNTVQEINVDMPPRWVLLYAKA